MKIKLTVLLFFAICFSGVAQISPNPAATRTIFAYGGSVTKQFMRYVITLTKKENPKICFLATATGDSPTAILAWYTACEDLPLRPYVQRVFIDSYTTPKTFAENLLSMDAIIVSGGNTLNMMAVWKAQGIDTVLRKAYDKGIILSGGSAGSLCWFQGGTTDSRPRDLSIVKCLGFIQASHCPHYHSELLRKPLYFENILKGKLSPGYAIDDRAGVVFENEKYIRTVAIDDKSNAYYVSVINGAIDEKLLPVTEIIK
ncbi:MAG TPA: peptidase E [Mucilaginibacter sp.]|jgi:peptidase E